MRAVKSILRWFLALQAAVLLLISAAGVLGGLKAHSRAVTAHAAPVHAHFVAVITFTLIAAGFALGVIYAMAWWTTRKPSVSVSIWGIAASALNVAQGSFLVWVSHLASGSRIRFSPADGLWFIVFGLAGLFVFSRRESLPDSVVGARKATPVAGDRTSLGTRHAVTALSVLAQIAMLFFWTRWSLTQHLPSYRGLGWIVLVTIASILTTLVHECGHAVLAWCFEMGLLSFRAGPFHAVKREGKWKFKFNLAGLITPGGSVGAVPTHPAQPRWEEIVMIVAGPCANLLVGTAAVWAVVHDRWASYPQTWELAAYTGAFCLIAAVLNLIPFLSEDGGYSDGARILQIVTRSPLDDFHRALASVASTGITSRRYRDLDIAQIERAAMLFPHDVRGLHLLLCACQYYEDCGQLPEASAALAAAQTIYDENVIDLPGPLHTVFVIGSVWLNRDAAAARVWWDRMEAKKDNRKNVDFWLAKAALLWIEGDQADAEDAWQEANLDAQRLPQFGAYEFDRFRCASLREMLNETPVPVSAEVPVPTTILEPVAVPMPVPAMAITPVAAPAQVVAAFASVPLGGGDPPAEAAFAVAPATMSITSATSGPAVSRFDEAIAPAPVVAAPEPVRDAMQVLGDRLGVLTRPIPKAAPIVPVPDAVSEPLASPAVPVQIAVRAPDFAVTPTVAPVPVVATPSEPAIGSAVARVPVAVARTIAIPAIVAPASSPIAADPIAPIAVEEAALAPPPLVEAMLPVPVAATKGAPDQTEVLVTRLGALTRPVPKSAPTTPIVETIIDPLAGSVTRIPAAALKAGPARISLTANLPEAAPLAPPKPNAPAVPAAFARRARPGPLPPSSGAAAFVPVEKFVPETLVFETPTFAAEEVYETKAVEASVVQPVEPMPTIVPAAAAVTASVPAPVTVTPTEVADVPAPPPEKPARYDPLDLIRAAAIESLNVSAS